MSLKTIRNLLIVAALGATGWWLNPWRTIPHPPGILVTQIPKQTNLPGKDLPDMAGWKLRAVAGYELHGRVLGTKRYHSGPSADLAPIDVAVGWGRMSDSAVLDQFDLSMGNRFFFYEWQNEPPLPEAELRTSAANNHVIAATDEVRATIRSLRPGHLVKLRGYLVDAARPGEGTWSSSRRRDDTGNGACEVFYVESAEAGEALPEEKIAPVSAMAKAGK